jgi:endonuclease/exonuclease/phosphatase family metal-dependent hydrolase
MTVLAGMLLVLVAWGHQGRAEEASPPARVRVLAYNIHHGRGTDGVVDLPRIAAVIRSAEPDLVTLQEVDDSTQRTGGVDQAAELGRLTGMHVLFGKQIDYQGGGYGQAILSRTPLDAPRVHPLPGDPDRETRIVFEATTRFHGRELVIASVHLHHRDAAARLAQAATAAELLGGQRIVILAGDLNARPGSEPLAVLLESFGSATPDGEAVTFPAGDPTVQLDHILFRPADALRVVEGRVLDEPIASDHRPILAVFELP